MQKLAEANQMIELGRQVLIANVAEQPKPISKAIGLPYGQSLPLALDRSRSGCFKRPNIHEREEALGLMILGETLSAALAKVISDLNVDLSGWLNDENSGWGPPAYFGMETSKWCPRSLKVIRGKLGRMRGVPQDIGLFNGIEMRLKS
ncbi:hypothetical protein CGCF413_v006459 [Colletotrichum fructicola]|nr:hypothetical protein CGCF413_v006459 [Colletotrichum fructicola]